MIPTASQPEQIQSPTYHEISAEKPGKDHVSTPHPVPAQLDPHDPIAEHEERDADRDRGRHNKFEKEIGARNTFERHDRKHVKLDARD